MNYRMVCFCLFVMALFVLGGCGGPQAGEQAPVRDSPEREPQDYREAIEETERQMERDADEMGVGPEGDAGSGVQSCVVMQQCGSGADLCWQGRCWTEDELFEEYEKCQDMKCRHLDCPECESGHEQCTIATAAGAGMYRLCVDCVHGQGCKAGYECEMGRCV